MSKVTTDPADGGTMAQRHEKSAMFNNRAGRCTDQG
jgi:hypothetical protein